MSTPASAPVDVLAVEEEAYKRSLQDSPAEQACFVIEAIGTRRAAAALGLRDARPLRGWADGRAVKEAATEQRLRVLYRVSYALTTVYSAVTAAAFWESTNPYLGDRSPLAVLATSDPTDGEAAVVSAGRALLEG